VIALLAAAHLYLFQWPGEPPKALFLLPTEGEKRLRSRQPRLRRARRLLERRQPGAKDSCEFRQWVDPGKLLPAWVDAGKITPGARSK